MSAKRKRWADIGYMGKHKRIWKKMGKATHCDNPFCKGESKTFSWANVSGNYKENLKDWKQMCMSCHMKQDHGRRDPTDTERLRIAVNGLNRIRDEINYIMNILADKPCP